MGDNNVSEVVRGSRPTVLQTKKSVSKSGQWEPYEGPRGGFGWRNTDTDEIVYQDDPPGEPDLSALSGEQIDALEEALGTDLTSSSDLPESAFEVEPQDIEKDDYVYIGEEEGFLDSVDRVGDDVYVELSSGNAFWVGDKDVHVDSEPQQYREEQEREELKNRIMSELSVSRNIDGVHVDTDEVVSTMADMVENTKHEQVTENLFSNLDEIDETSRGSYFNYNDSKGIYFDSSATEGTVAHETAHAVANTNGYDYNDRRQATMFAHIFNMRDRYFRPDGSGDSILDPRDTIGKTWREVEQDMKEVWRDTYASSLGIDFSSPITGENRYVLVTKDAFKLSHDGETNSPEEVDRLIEEVNNAWEKQFDNWGEFGIGGSYSGTNAHETLAMIHEHLQKPGVNKQVMRDLVNDFPDLLDAYLDVFEPNDLQERELEKEGVL